MNYEKIKKFLWEDAKNDLIQAVSTLNDSPLSNNEYIDLSESISVQMEGNLNQYKKYVNISKIIRNIQLNRLKNREFEIVLESNIRTYPCLFDNFTDLPVVVCGFPPVQKILKITSIPLFDIYDTILNGLATNDKKSVFKGLNELKLIIKRINPKLIFLYSSTVISSRSIILVSRELGIKTVEIQHGVYTDFRPLPGKDVDMIFVWGNYFKDLYIQNQGRNANEVKVLGYPRVIKKFDKQWDGNIVYLGQNFETSDETLFNHKFLFDKISTIKNIERICENLNLNFYYKPHPGDDIEYLKSKLPNTNFLLKSFEDSLKIGDIFISFNSTSLVEAALASKICVQLINYDIRTDNFEELGVCYSCNNFKDLELFLMELNKNKNYNKNNKTVNSNYINTNYNISTRFLDLINEIVVKN